ncbi:MAG: putative toxin-antitoxin system toxin component, PIN family, partial [Bacteroidota bacterium]
TDILTSQQIDIVLTDQLRTEIIEVSRRKKFQKYFNERKVKELLKLMDFLGTNYEIIDYPNICRDQKDNFLLGLIRASKADYLVTGDQDLLKLNPFEGTEIIEANQLLVRMADN